MNVKKKFIGLIMVGAIAVSQFTGVKPAAAAEAQATRIYGATRYETADSIATKFWSSSDYAVLARGDMYPDALCAAPLAYAYGAPILLTDPKTITTATSSVLSSLNVKTVFIVGGTGAVSSQIETSLKSKYTVVRITGSTRYDTSVAIAKLVKEKLGTVSNAVLATGENYPDALSVSSIAAKNGMPILLTYSNSLPSAVNAFIKGNSVTKTYVIGGTGVISNAVAALTTSPKRLGGSDRFATNVAVMNEFAGSFDFNKLFIAVGNGPTGTGFADALSGSAAAAKTSSPVVLVYQSLSAGTESFLAGKMSGFTNLTILGGSAVVPDSVGTKLLTYINVPALTGISLTDKASGNKVTAVVDETAGKITFTIPSAYSKFDGGTAVLSEDLSSASLSSPGFTWNVSNINKSDNFASIIFSQMSAVGYDPANGVLSSNIKYLLNGATLKLTDAQGHVKTYTIVINY